MLTGIYLGMVEKVGDPEKLGRLKVRVPGVYGIQGGVVGAVPVDDLPWALPMGLPAGGSNDSGGFSMLPEIGDQVAIQFLDGEPEKPVWQWLMQTQKQAKELQLHQYVAVQEKGQEVAGSASRAILTRYGHSLELKTEKVTLSTKEGQQVLLQTSESEAGGAAALQTPKGQRVTLSDLRENVVIQGLEAAVISAKEVSLNAPTSTLIKTERFTILAGSSIITIQGTTLSVTTGSGAFILVDKDGTVAVSSAGKASLSLGTSRVQLAEPNGTGLVLEDGKMSISAQNLVVNTSSCSIGTNNNYPVMLFTPAIEAFLLSHTHPNGNNGSPTGTPTPPVIRLQTASTTLETS